MILRQTRRGLALAAVLWIVAAATVIGASIQLSARDLTSAVENRVALNRLRWQAYGCGEAVVASLVRTLSGPAHDPEWRRKWLDLDRAVQPNTTDGVPPCEVTAIPAGSRFRVRGLVEPGAKSLVAALATTIDPLALSAALADWEDADDIPRPFGAEREWYLSRARAVPRNDTVRSYEELRLVRGFVDWPQLESTLTLDDAPIAINVAQRDILATLPGFALSTADEVVAQRERGRFPSSHQELLNLLSPDAAQRLLPTFAALVDRSTLDPWEWEIIIVVSDDRLGLRARESFAVIPSDGGVTVREYRQW